MKRLPPIVLLLTLLAASPAAGQHAGHDAPATPPAAHDHGVPPAQDHAGHGAGAATAAELPVGRDPAPPAIPLGAADALFGAARMETARGVLSEAHGGALLWKVMLDRAEYRAGASGAGYGWDAEAWLGGDIHRVVLKTEGEGAARGGLHAAEWQALYSRAIGPYTDLQFGLRQDVSGHVATHAAFGVETILPYWLKADAALFLSTKGDALARLEGSYDLMLTQLLVLQPALEFNFALQDIPAASLRGGLTDVTAGFRLRYDIARNFSPYIGVEHGRKTGGTAALHRALGAPAEETLFVLGLRSFF